MRTYVDGILFALLADAGMKVGTRMMAKATFVRVFHVSRVPKPWDWPTL